MDKTTEENQTDYCKYGVDCCRVILYQNNKYINDNTGYKINHETCLKLHPNETQENLKERTKFWNEKIEEFTKKQKLLLEERQSQERKRNEEFERSKEYMSPELERSKPVSKDEIVSNYDKQTEYCKNEIHCPRIILCKNKYYNDNAGHKINYGTCEKLHPLETQENLRKRMFLHFWN